MSYADATGSGSSESQGAGWKSADSRAQPPRETMRGATTRRLKRVRRAAPIPLPCKRLPKLLAPTSPRSNSTRRRDSLRAHSLARSGGSAKMNVHVTIGRHLVALERAQGDVVTGVSAVVMRPSFCHAKPPYKTELAVRPGKCGQCGIHITCLLSVIYQWNQEDRESAGGESGTRKHYAIWCGHVKLPSRIDCERVID